MPDGVEGIIIIIGREEEEEMEAIVKAVVIGVLTVAIAALEQSGGDEG